ncbi:MAG: TspO/MBR family protein [Marinicella sp.]
MSNQSIQIQIIGLIGWLVLCFVASAIGAFGSMAAPAFYAGLIQPVWAPPAWLFGPVWTALYALMAISAWLVWRHGGFKQQSAPLTLFVVQLTINAFWSWLFFAWQQGLWSLIDIMILWILIVMTIWTFWRINKLAGVLLIPYMLWVSFAAILNYYMWQLNPEILA